MTFGDVVGVNADDSTAPVRVELSDTGVWVGHFHVLLTKTERAVLGLLLQHRGRLFTKEELLLTLYAGMDMPGVKIIDVFVCKLRKKLAAVGEENLIRTIWGRGYMVRTYTDADRGMIGRALSETIAATKHQVA